MQVLPTKSPQSVNSKRVGLGTKGIIQSISPNEFGSVPTTALKETRSLG
jgi:hypothetical protein